MKWQGIILTGVGILLTASLTILSIVISLQSARIGALETRICALEVGLRDEIRALNQRIDQGRPVYYTPKNLTSWRPADVQE